MILPVGMAHMLMCSETSITELHVYWYGRSINIVIQQTGMGSHIDTDWYTCGTQTWSYQLTDTGGVIPQRGGMNHTIIITQQIMQTGVLQRNHGCLIWWKWCNPWISKWIAIMTVQACPALSIHLLGARVSISHSMAWGVLMGRASGNRLLRVRVLMEDMVA